jgi:excisionase family DNA binding protein
MSFDDFGNLLTLNDVCELLNIKEATASKLCRSGQLHHAKMIGHKWLIPKSDIVNFVYDRTAA